MDSKKLYTIDEAEEQYTELLRRQNNYMSLNYELHSKELIKVLKKHIETEELLDKISEKLSNV